MGLGFGFRVRVRVRANPDPNLRGERYGVRRAAARRDVPYSESVAQRFGEHLEQRSGVVGVIDDLLLAALFPRGEGEVAHGEHGG